MSTFLRRAVVMEKSLKELERRIVKSFLDIAIMSILKENGKSNNTDLNGYEILRYIYSKLGIFISSGTVYSTLYALERRGFVRAIDCAKSRTYKLTSKGLNRLGEINRLPEAFNLFLTKLCNVKAKQVAYSTVTL
jgi:DNA-binding PadR family transcriptional regulator